MKKIIYTFSLIAFIFCSCEKVIDIDLNKADSRIVIEGNITDQAGPYTVRISKTVNFDESNTFPAISGALVKISDNAGNSETLTETQPGIYTTTNIQGVSGRTYTLTVTIGEKIYAAISTMPQTVNLDTLLVEELAGPHSSGKIIQAQYSDPAGVANFYRFTLSVNNIDKELIIINDDRLQDGQLITRPVPHPSQRTVSINSGNTVKVELHAIDENVYEYFRTLNQTEAQGHSGSATPANPLTNIANGALGYFSAHTVRTKTIVIP